jgi:hypothetical protein
MAVKTGRLPQLCAWVMSGLILDALSLFTLQQLLNVFGPLTGIGRSWLEIIALLATPWLIHVTLLPTIFRLHTRSVTPWSWLGRTTVFITVGAFMVPMLGIPVFSTAVIVMLSLNSIIAMPLTSVNQTLAWFIFVAVWLLPATAVAAFVGVLLSMQRPSKADDSSMLLPPFRSDVMGGAVAGFLSFGGMFAASSFGLFSRPVSVHDELHQLAVPPLTWPAIIIGTLALLPHLVLLGLDEFHGRSAPKKLVASQE